MSNQCSNNDIISPSGVDHKYRFFNQPIEQIPGFDINKPQILAHPPGCGLVWITVDQCMDIVTCLSLESDRLKVTRNNVVVIKDFGELTNDTQCDVLTVSCVVPSPSPSPSV